jgi:hypothetical protein
VRVLFVAYCFGGDRGQTLIGVYKRALRVAMELCDRGHEVFVFCSGRDGYQDDLTRAAETRVRFVDLGLEEEPSWADPRVRAGLLEEMSGLELDMVIIGEAPVTGVLLEATLCATELRLPAVLLDNAYDRVGVYRTCMQYGAMVDAMVLTGTSSQHAHLPSPPPWLCQVPPYIESSTESARRLIAELGLTGDQLVAVLAYDQKVQDLALSLLARLDGSPDRADTEYLFMVRRPDGAPELLDTLPESLRARVRVVPIPPDPVLFGVVQLARVAIVKYGYMQVTECLALRTPVVARFHEGNTWVDRIPTRCQRFVHVTQEADGPTADAVARFLRVRPDEMADIHNGELGAAATTARFLEQLPRSPRPEISERSAWLGFREERVRRALAEELRTESLQLDTARAMFLREVPDGELYGLLCRCTVDGAERSVRLWGRLYGHPGAVERELVTVAGSDRRILFARPEDRILIEADLGQQLLPAL